MEELRGIREELKELRLLYKGLVEKLIPVEEPTKEEREAIESEDKIIGEEELIKSLSK
ncbi:MAG: hypothetical protein ACE5GD_10130 [Candidatus Geothermarchaeales archaeon]